MSGADDVRPRRLHLRVDRKGRLVDVVVALDDLTTVVDPDQVRLADMRERHAERVDPECVRLDRVTRGDVTGDALLEPELREQPEAGGEALLAVQALLLRRGERRQAREPLLTHGARLLRPVAAAPGYSGEEWSAYHFIRSSGLIS